MMRRLSILVAAVALPCAALLAVSNEAFAQGPGIVAGAARSAAPANDVQPVHRRRHTGRNVGIGLGILGAAILLNEAARADGHRRYGRDSRCGRMLYRCEGGSGYWCERYEASCM